MRTVRTSAFESDAVSTSASGHVYLLKWLYEKWNDDAAKQIVWQFTFFYAFMLVGFVFLYIMIKSTGQVRSQLREIRRNVVDAFNEQKERKWDLDEYSKTMNVGFM